MKVLRPLLVFAVLCLVWQAIVVVFDMPRFILPPPLRVAAALVDRWDLLLHHALITLLEIVLGLAAGAMLGFASALTLAYWAPARRWLLPVLVVSQAIPVFAIAPLLVLWFGYGIASKVAAAMLIIYFPVTSAFYDGLRRTEPGFLDLATVDGGWTMADADADPPARRAPRPDRANLRHDPANVLRRKMLMIGAPHSSARSKFCRSSWPEPHQVILLKS